MKKHVLIDNNISYITDSRLIYLSYLTEQGVHFLTNVLETVSLAPSMNPVLFISKYITFPREFVRS